MGLLEDASKEAEAARKREAERIAVQRDAWAMIDRCAREFAEAATAHSFKTSKLRGTGRRVGWFVQVVELHDMSWLFQLMIMPDGTWHNVSINMTYPIFGQPRKVFSVSKDPLSVGSAEADDIYKAFRSVLSSHLLEVQAR